ncbi:DUF853 family protein [Mesorhizobium sp. M0938]|uniref:ATP-binding protein n=1 Tax=unclassified Mesorhizobium TaxID=325217 RepID=UPI0033375725
MSVHPIPDDALDADIAILGKKGGGKTYTSKGIVERLLDMGRRVLVLDPLGVWAGLRTSADGEGPGYPVAIFGGPHADMPLDTAAAVAMADILARENVPAVIDLSELTKSAQQGFLLKFLHELRRVNRDALTIVLEEADVFAPQNPQGDDSKQLHGEIDWIARRGRFRGFRLITITQRPARLSKDVLTQANTLIIHRLPAPQDRDAAKAWVDGNGDRDKSKEVFDTLAGLNVGEAWVLSQDPTMLERKRFPTIKTLDTSATPKAGEKRIEPKTLADVDVSAIREALEATLPASKKVEKFNTANTADIVAAEAQGFERGFDEGTARGRLAGIAIGLQRAKQAIDAMRTDDEENGIPATIEAESRPVEVRLRPVPAANRIERATDLASDPLLNAALQVWPAKMTWAGLASMCGRKARGGHFNTKRKRLIEAGLMVEEGDLAVPGSPPAIPAGVIPADLLEQNLPQPAQKMFATIRRSPGIDIYALANELGMQPRGGHWNTGMSILRKNGLITESNGLRIAAGLEATK